MVTKNACPIQRDWTNQMSSKWSLCLFKKIKKLLYYKLLIFVQCCYLNLKMSLCVLAFFSFFVPLPSSLILLLGFLAIWIAKYGRTDELKKIMAANTSFPNQSHTGEYGDTLPPSPGARFWKTLQWGEKVILSLFYRFSVVFLRN